MLLLSPAKLLVILVVALFVLGPDKLPKVAKQIGGFWADIRRLREKLESEVRDNFPDLPSTDTIHKAVRSPLSFLDGLSGDGDGDGDGGTTGVGGTTVAPEPDVGHEPPKEGVGSASGYDGVLHHVGSGQRHGTDDAELN